MPDIESFAGGGSDATVLQWVAGVLACGEVTVLRGDARRRRVCRAESEMRQDADAPLLIL